MTIDETGGITAQLTIAIGGLQKAVEKLQRDRAGTTPVDVTHQAVGTSGSSGNLTINAGRPELGRVRLLRQVAVGGRTVSDTPAGTAYLFKSGQSTDFSIASLIDFTANALPQCAFYTGRQVVVKYPEHLWCYITSPTANTVYTVASLWEDYEERAFLEAFAL